MKKNYKEFSRNVYEQTFRGEVGRMSKGKRRKSNGVENLAQREAIKNAILQTMEKYPEVEPALIWKGIYEVHVHHKSGLDDSQTIARVISADQSWKKSSGHAFEEMIKLLANASLDELGIEILLQRDLNTLIKAGELANEPRDISWLKEQIKGSVFDLFALFSKEGKRYCYGCIQSKTSIRDRVTRDREPSIAAMQSFFWSSIIVLDGEFLKQPKFTAMVDGGTSEYPDNGWHGLYVFSEKYKGERIYPLQLDFKRFSDHAVAAAKYWETQRQWFDKNWKAE